MNILARTKITLAGFVLLTATASCGSASDPTGAGVGGSSGGGGSASGGAFGGGDGGASAPVPCSTPGSTQSCCMNGTQTCNAGAGEFPAWGTCLDPAGVVLVCAIGGCSSSVASGPEGVGCDGGGALPPPAGPPGPLPAICTDMTINNEPEILVGYSPASGQTVGLNGQIKVWVNDEHMPFIAPGEQVNPTTGAITTPGNRTATASDGLLWEPALYIAPQTPLNGGTPHFPQWIKGWYANNPPKPGSGGFQVPGIDPAPPGTTLAATYTGEDIWDVSSLGLAPGTYTGVFSVHDGDGDRAIGCITLVITP